MLSLLVISLCFFAAKTRHNKDFINLFFSSAFRLQLNPRLTTYLTLYYNRKEDVKIFNPRWAYAKWYTKKWSQITNIFKLHCHFSLFPSIIYLFQNHNENTRTVYVICSKLSIKALKCHWRYSDVFINFNIFHIFWLFLLLPLGLLSLAFIWF